MHTYGERNVHMDIMERNGETPTVECRSLFVTGAGVSHLLTLHDTVFYASADQLRQIRDAINEHLGDVAPTPEPVEQFPDCEPGNVLVSKIHSPHLGIIRIDEPRFAVGDRCRVVLSHSGRIEMEEAVVERIEGPCLDAVWDFRDVFRYVVYEIGSKFDWRYEFPAKDLEFLGSPE